MVYFLREISLMKRKSIDRNPRLKQCHPKGKRRGKITQIPTIMKPIASHYSDCLYMSNFHMTNHLSLAQLVERGTVVRNRYCHPTVTGSIPVAENCFFFFPSFFFFFPPA